MAQLVLGDGAAALASGRGGSGAGAELRRAARPRCRAAGRRPRHRRRARRGAAPRARWTSSRASEARVEHIRAQTDLGAHLRRANRRAEAREHLRAALDGAHHAGAGAIAARAETELRATGARPRRVALSGLDSLTASERRVAELAREGMTNREIAQTLFVTARTVEGHLTQVFRKLDLSARDELAGALAPPGG